MADFTTQDLIRKLRSIPGMTLVTDKAALLYAVLEDSSTPKWVKAVIVAALVYLINPVDAVPDVIPGLGYSDDLGVLVAALRSVKAHIFSDHHSRAKQLLKQV